MEKVLIKGNEAIAEAAMKSGCKLFFGYPITPSTEIMEYLAKHFHKVGGTLVQGEDEIASINMCYGAAATGARVFTASSSPGISLKQEGISYLAAAELPVVIINVNRSGPGLGGLGASQSDYFQSTKGGGHGDYRLIVLAPSKAQEMYDYTMLAFDLADKHRNPVLVLADGFLGQMMEPVELKEAQKIQLPEKDWITNGAKGRDKRKIASYALTNEVAEASCLNWQKKYQDIKDTEQMWEDFQVEDAEYLIVGYGTCGRIAKSIVLAARAQGVKLGLIRPITLWPFPEKAFQNIIAKGILTLELNSGQMIEDVKLAVNCNIPVHFYSRQGGMLPTQQAIFDKLNLEFNLNLKEGL